MIAAGILVVRHMRTRDENVIKKTIKIGGFVGLGWFALTAAAAAMQSRLLFKPEKLVDKPRPTENTHRMRSVSLFSNDGIRLSGLLFTPRTNARYPMVVYFGGRSEDVRWITQDVHRLFPNMGVLAVNYRGYGESAGTPSEPKIIEDANLIIEWLTKVKNVDVANIAVVGRSLGSGVATQIAARHAVGASVFITPYDSIAAIARRRYPWVPNFVLKHRFDALSAAGAIRCPVLVLRAETDNVIPAIHTDRFIGQLATPPRQMVIPGSDHGNIPYLAQSQETIAQFLREALKPGQ